MRIIKNENDRREALARIDALMAQDILNEEEAEELELQAFLVDQYEAEYFPIDFPDPVEAIRFRMEQLGMTQDDLGKLLGGKSKASEILNRKRTLTLSMIRTLNAQLGIPADVLLGEAQKELPASYDGLDWNRFPIKELVKRGYLIGKNLKNNLEEQFRAFLASAGNPTLTLTCHRQGTWNGQHAEAYATFAWEIAVRAKALKNKPSVRYSSDFGEEHMKRLAHYSIMPNGPLHAKTFLDLHGITLVYEPHFPKTYLDGAAMLLEEHPVVALTIRYNRIDSFWFSLFHELAHIALGHITSSRPCIFDFDNAIPTNSNEEDAANKMASNCLIPDEIWLNSNAKKTASKQAIENLARELGIHPGIVAGRVRKDRKNYRIHTRLVNEYPVRELFH